MTQGVSSYFVRAFTKDGPWKNAKSLIVVTNGALGLFPLGILVPEPTVTAHGAELKFTDYRRVFWLVRTHATVQVSSVSALRTLRQLPSGAPTRESLIGFGDPLFSAAQALEASQQASCPYPAKPFDGAAIEHGLSG
jgi:hypothetical protein